MSFLWALIMSVISLLAIQRSKHGSPTSTFHESLSNSFLKCWSPESFIPSSLPSYCGESFHGLRCSLWSWQPCFLHFPNQHQPQVCDTGAPAQVFLTPCHQAIARWGQHSKQGLQGKSVFKTLSGCPQGQNYFHHIKTLCAKLTTCSWGYKFSIGCGQVMITCKVGLGLGIVLLMAMKCIPFDLGMTLRRQKKY